MLTPNELKEKEFTKAFLNGYDPMSVDDFLERVTMDYEALYKENTVLKSKLKLLVEKIEEYRVTEDSMRVALFNAQKMGSDLIEKARRQGEAVLAEINDKVAKQSAQMKAEFEAENKRLEIAQAKTAVFKRKALEMIAEQTELLENLDKIIPDEVKNKQEHPQVMVDEIRSVEKHAKKQRSAGKAKQSDPPAGDAEDKVSDFFNAFDQDQFSEDRFDVQQQAEKKAKGREKKTVDMARSISRSLGDEAEIKSDPDAFWDDEDEPTTKRPKFQFDDLKFGANLQEDE